jgi:hypothetical protein
MEKRGNAEDVAGWIAISERDGKDTRSARQFFGIVPGGHDPPIDVS